MSVQSNKYIKPLYLPFLAFYSLVLCSFELHAQSVKKYDDVVTRISGFYNTNNYDSIFSYFAPEMAKALPLSKARTFFEQTKISAGMMLSTAFAIFEDNYALYDAKFERRRFSLYISLDKKSNINGFYLQPCTGPSAPQIKRNVTELTLPFDSTWSVLWGGNTNELNYHIDVPVQKYAFDFIVVDEYQKAYRSDSKTNEDYYAFGRRIIAPCDGQVVLVVDGIKDNEPGVVNPIFVTGNTVILKTNKGEYLVFAHFKQHSTTVKEGQLIKTGDLLGLCGNSGNSLEPHLHFHIQNEENINSATGVECYFARIIVNGRIKSDYSPIKGERIGNSSSSAVKNSIWAD